MLSHGHCIIAKNFCSFGFELPYGCNGIGSFSRLADGNDKCSAEEQPDFYNEILKKSPLGQECALCLQAYKQLTQPACQDVPQARIRILSTDKKFIDHQSLILQIWLSHILQESAIEGHCGWFEAVHGFL